MGSAPAYSIGSTPIPKFFFLNLTEKSSQITMPKGSGLTKPMKLSAELADIVGKKEASRAECIKQLWAYLKKNNLQDPENKQFFIPDKKMAKVFGNDKIRAFGMAKFLSAHLFEKKMCVLIKMNAITDYYLLNYMYSKIKSIL